MIQAPSCSNHGTAERAQPCRFAPSRATADSGGFVMQNSKFERLVALRKRELRDCSTCCFRRTSKVCSSFGFLNGENTLQVEGLTPTGRSSARREVDPVTACPCMCRPCGHTTIAMKSKLPVVAQPGLPGGTSLLLSLS